MEILRPSRLDPAAHPRGGGMPTYTLTRMNGCQREISVLFGPDRTLNALAVELDHPFKLAPFPGGVVHPAFRAQGPLGPLYDFGGDFDGGPANAGPPGLHALHSELPWGIPSGIQFRSDCGSGITILGEYGFQMLMVDPDVAINVHLTRQVALLPSPHRGYLVKDSWTAKRDSRIMLIAHPNFLVTEGTRIMVSAATIQARDPKADAGLKDWQSMEGLGESVPEQCFFLSDIEAPEGLFRMLCVDKSGQFGCAVRYEVNDLPPQLINGCIWEDFGDGVVGLEFGSLPIGREAALKATEPHRQLFLLKRGDALETLRQVEFLEGNDLHREIELIQSVCPNQQLLDSHGKPL